MAQISGIPVSDSDAWWLIGELRMAGRADDATAAFAIELGVTADEPVEWLTPDQCEAVLAVLEVAPGQRLRSLRHALARDQRDRLR